MSVFVIGDENTVIGFSLIGIEGEVVEATEEARSALNEAVETEGVDLVLVTEQWATQMRETVDDLKMTQTHPLVLEVPGEDTEPSGKSLRDLVQQAVGIHLGG